MTITFINVFYNTTKKKEYLIPKIGETIIVPLNEIQIVNEKCPGCHIKEQ